MAMKSRNFISGILAVALAAGLFPLPSAFAQEGPQSPSSETVAKPKKQPAPQAPDQQQQNQGEIPSQYKKQKGEPTEEGPTFRADATTVTVPVSVLDQKGRFIPNIPQGYFRVLEDGVPQQISGFAKGEAPLTVCLLIEFSGQFQQYWSWG